MRLGVISDTHGHVKNTRAAIEKLVASRVEGVIHCGDIGSPAIPSLFAPWPTHFIFGNIDQNEEELAQAIEKAGQTCHGRFGTLTLAGVRIAFLHGDDSRRWHETIASGEWDLVCFGHTHARLLRRENETVVLNPGAVFRANPHSAAVVELPQRDVEFIEF